MANLISNIAGTDIYEGHTYRVTYNGQRPRHDGAIWKFTYRGRGGTAHGEIVYHSSDSVLQKFKNQDLYVSSKFDGDVVEVAVDLCVGWGHNQCENFASYQQVNGVSTRVTGPSTVVRDVPAVGDARCGSCEQEHQRWFANQAAEAKKNNIESALDAAIAARRSGVVEEAPVAAPIVRQAERVLTEAADGSHVLSHKVPDATYLTRYVSRTIDGMKDLDVLDYAASVGENVLLSGPTGSSKTSVVYAWAAKNQRPLVNVPCNGAIDPSTLYGRPTILADGSVDYIESDVTKVLRFGGVLYLDELNFAPAKVLSVLHGALDARRQVTIPELGYLTFDVHPQCFMVATYNPGYEDTRELNKAFQNRWAVQLEWGYDSAVERQLIVQLPVLHQLAEQVRKLVDVQDIETPLGPNKLMEFERHAMDMSLDMAVRIFLNGFKSHERDQVSELVLHHRDVLERQLEAAKAQQVA